MPIGLKNHYTVITTDKFGQYKQTAYAVYFPQEIGSIVSIFDEWISGVSAFPLHSVLTPAALTDKVAPCRMRC